MNKFAGMSPRRAAAALALAALALLPAAHARVRADRAPAPASAAATAAPPQTADARREWESLQARFNDRGNYGLLMSGVWTLTHDAGREAGGEVEALLKFVTKISEPFERQDVGGASGFKERVAAALGSGDDAVRGFAATLLAVAGDRAYAPRIAALLERRDPPGGGDSPRELHSRGRAAAALGLLGAREHTARFVSMLRSPNMYDRAGAAHALGLLGAREHARAVAALLTHEEFRFYDSGAAIGALFQMGAAAGYADLFAAVMRGDPTADDSETAAYALAALKSRRHAGEIAKLLGKKYRRGKAAKALAVMGAKEYAPRIARMLRGDDSLAQGDALLALGVLGAREYVPEIVRLMRREKESSVSNHAAEALVLLGATAYASEVVPLVENGYREKLYLTADDFHPLVEEDLKPLRRRYEASFLKMRARLGKR